MKFSLRIIFLFAFVIASLSSSAQLPSITAGANGSLSLWYGYSRGLFSSNDLNVSGKGYDLAVSPTNGYDEWNFAENGTITVPQLTARISYVFNRDDMFGFELSWDHLKYLMAQNGVTHLKGTIDTIPINADTLLTEDIIKMEHEVNLVELSAVKGFMLYGNRNYHQIYYVIVKAGGGLVIPRGDLKVFGNMFSDQYHVGGYTAGAEAAFRFVFNLHFDAETGIKYSYINCSNAIAADGISASHSFTCLQWLFSIGYQFNL